ncbi:amino acid permease [Streptomyces sp. NPDC051572]|uniref:APC family permease n=1 Tax=Streptomyces sp. NPDC051572 TaxID=3155802 RepID=UPI00344F3C6B
MVAWAGCVEVFVNSGHKTAISIGIALIGLRIPAAINLTGVRNMGALQVFTTVRKFIPLLFMATIGLLFIDPHNFGPFNASGQSAMGAIPAAAPIALFSHIGLEAASVVAGRVREPGRNVPRATVYGTLACAVIYILGTFAVFGTVSHGRLGASAAPFTDAANNIPGGTWASDTVAVAAISPASAPSTAGPCSAPRCPTPPPATDSSPAPSRGCAARTASPSSASSPRPSSPP